MKRLAWIAGALALALGLAVIALQTPRPLGADAPLTAFSAGRAMADVRPIAERAHPVGSADHARVQAYLLRRMDELGLSPSTQSGPLPARSARRLGRMGGDQAARSITNLVGVLPGADPKASAVVLMAHYDTTPASPGAADDSTGVAAILEAVRAIKARGPARRPLIVLLTDAEELDLDGARLFFGRHPLREAVGAVVNLEARGGGGRAVMFETGRGNAQMIDIFAQASARAPGGPTSNSLAVLVYALMPNGTDFTIPKTAGTPGANFAFLGRPGQYHSARSTPQALDKGSVQHIGSLALEVTDAMLRAPALPAPSRNVVYADLFGQATLTYRPVVGWVLLALSWALVALAVVRGGLSRPHALADLGRGALEGLWFVCAGLAVIPAVGLLAGPPLFDPGPSGAYYDRLARLSWMEAAAGLIVLFLSAIAVIGRRRVGRLAPAAALAVGMAAALAADRLDPVIVAAFVVALSLSLAPGLAPTTTSGAWLGLILMGLALATAVQAAAPEAAFILAWPVLLAATAAAVGVRPWPAFVGTVVGGGWLMVQSHYLFLGVGADMPAVLALTGFLTLMLARPLAGAGAGLPRV